MRVNGVLTLPTAGELLSMPGKCSPCGVKMTMMLTWRKVFPCQGGGLVVVSMRQEIGLRL
jgi:hypothetical protein